MSDQEVAIKETSADAFGRLRVSNPNTIFDSKLLQSDKAPLFWEESLESGAGITATTPNPDQPYIDFQSTTDTAGKYTRQTYQRFNYQPGKSQLILMTGVLRVSGGGTGVETRVGYFDDNNGIFFEENDGTIGVTVRSKVSGSVVDNTITQANWNIDNVSGSGNNPSKLNVDWTKAQIFVIDFQWLGVGRVRVGIEIDGVVVYVHQFVEHANITAKPYMSTPNLPLRYQMITTGSSPATRMRCICSAVLSEGGTDDIGIVHRASTGGAALTTDTENALFAMLAIRLKATHIGATVKFLAAQLQIQSASEYLEWQLLFNPTVAGAALSFSNIANSACQFALGVTANTVTGGTQITGGYSETGGGNTGGASDSGALASALKLGINIAGDSLDEMILCVRPIGAVSAINVEGGLTWREIY